jgi:MFS family permease
VSFVSPSPVSYASHSFVGALLTRFFLGFVEAAFFPGALFLISKWYKRSELGQRTALLACGSLISNAFGALIASGILDAMDGKLGRAAWRYAASCLYYSLISVLYQLSWLFYIEGTITVAVAIIAIFVLPDFPTSSTSWLTPPERQLALERMKEDYFGVDEEEETGSKSFSFESSGLWLALGDGKVWWLALTLTSMVVSLSFNAFFPTLSATMGFSRTGTLLLCAPPWVFATVVAFGVTRFGFFFCTVSMRLKV